MCKVRLEGTPLTLEQFRELFVQVMADEFDGARVDDAAAIKGAGASQTLVVITERPHQEWLIPLITIRECT